MTGRGREFFLIGLWLAHFARSANALLGGDGFLRLGDDGIKGRFGLVVGVEQERATGGAPRDTIVHAPEGDDLNRIGVLEERPEQVRLLGRETLIRFIDEAALSRGGIAGDVSSGVGLAGARDVDVELRDVNGQAECL